MQRYEVTTSIYKQLRFSHSLKPRIVTAQDIDHLRKRFCDETRKGNSNESREDKVKDLATGRYIGTMVATYRFPPEDEDRWHWEPANMESISDARYIYPRTGKLKRYRR